MKDKPAHPADNLSLNELIDAVIWETVMEGTAHCGWTDRARGGLVKHIQENVRWALEFKGVAELQKEQE